MADAAAARTGREGSRWYNVAPSGEDVAEWFKENVKIDPALDHADYVTGITMIPGEEKSKQVVGFRDNNTPVIQEVTNLVFTPYPRVDSRVKYFHDLMAAHSEDWVGLIEPVPIQNKNGVVLPPGFFPYAVTTGPQQSVRYVCCSMRVRVYDADTYELEKVKYRDGRVEYVPHGRLLVDAPPATKMIPVMKRFADDHALMKAETGAVGRALGMAGMLVVPGAGVATAEDMGELAASQDNPSQPTPEQVAPSAVAEPEATEGAGPTDDELRAHAASIIKELESQHPEKFQEFQALARERKWGKLSESSSPALKGIVRALERKLDEALNPEAAPAEAPAS